jgi:hypothetical protein
MGAIRSLVGLLVVLSTIYVGSLVLPAYIANFRLEEAINDVAGELSRNLPATETEEDARSHILAEARALDIALTPQQVEVRRIRNEGVAWADYTVRLDFPVHPVDLHFQPASRSKKSAMGM